MVILSISYHLNNTFNFILINTAVVRTTLPPVLLFYLYGVQSAHPSLALPLTTTTVALKRASYQQKNEKL